MDKFTYHEYDERIKEPKYKWLLLMMFDLSYRSLKFIKFNEIIKFGKCIFF